MSTIETTTGGSRVLHALGSFARARETSILIALVLVIVVATVRNPTFLFSSDGFRDLLLTPSILLLVAVGQAIVIITRNVDLSVGSVLGLTAYLTGRLFVDVPGIPFWLVFPIGIVFGGLLGLINGALVAFAKVPALVDHARHPVRVPRHQRAVDRQRPHQLLATCRRTSWRWARAPSSTSRC